MAYGELYIPPTYIVEHINPVNGRFLKGHVPANKGKKWSEWAGKRAQKRMAKGWKNIELHRCCGHPNAGRQPKPLIAVRDDGTWVYFPNSHIAASTLGIERGNISRCCRCNEKRHVNRKTGKINTDHSYQGYRFYFETDDIWTTKINS